MSNPEHDKVFEGKTNGDGQRKLTNLPDKAPRELKKQGSAMFIVRIAPGWENLKAGDGCRYEWMDQEGRWRTPEGSIKSFDVNYNATWADEGHRATVGIYLNKVCDE